MKKLHIAYEEVNLQSALRLREASFAYNLSRIRFLTNENILTVRYSVRISVSVRSVQAKINYRCIIVII